MSRRENKHGPAALQAWAKQVTDGYPGVNVNNMTTAWKNGLAFCALIHRFHPELIDYDSLDPENIVGNCSLAFEIAESKLGIPQLLDPLDMSNIDVPDKLCIMTYVAQFYNVLKNAEKRSNMRATVQDENSHLNSLDGRIPKVETGSKRSAAPSSDEILEATRENGPKRPVLLSSQAVCTACSNPVFLSERVIFSKKLYHRSCLRCSNCDSVLNPNTVDITPDGKVFCLEKDCHRKLLQQMRGDVTDCGRKNDGLSAEGETRPDPDSASEKNGTGLQDSEPSDVIHVVEEKTSAEEATADDKLNIEVVENPPNESDKRTVSFSAIVEVAKIESDSTTDVITASDSVTTAKLEDTTCESNSPKVRHKNVIEFLKENLETMGTAAPEDSLTTDANHETAKTVDAINGEHETSETEGSEKNGLTNGEHATAKTEESESTVATNGEHEQRSEAAEFPTIVEKDAEESVSHNESGVGDSLDSESKSEPPSVDTSEYEHKDKTPSECGEQAPNAGSPENNEDTPPQEVSPVPVVRPRKARSKSPAVTDPSPVPTPRKKISTNQLWKTKDYYPSELNPFESEDSLVIEPSDVLVVKKASSRERLTPPNPFEEDDDEEQQSPQQQQNKFITPSPKSPASSIRSTGSGNGTVSGRPRKSRRAPLPPSMTSPASSQSSPISPSKRPAPPPPPRQSPSLPVASTPTPTPEKRLIPASPNLLKGLKDKTNKAAAQQYRKKRRAPPPKRHVAPLPEETIKTELSDLAIKEKELERQGITLEANIRKLMSQDDDDLADQVDEMVVQLWNVVNEKNDIVRRQTELDYLRRGHRLEQMQAEVEFQLRMLMETPAEQRQPNQEEAEQQLLQELLKIVDERNEVVDWLDFHRQLDREEDLHVSQSLSSFSSVNSRASTPAPTQVVLPMESETNHHDQVKTTNGCVNESAKTAEEKSHKKDKFKIGGIFTTLKKKKKSSKSKRGDEEKEQDETAKVS